MNIETKRPTAKSTQNDNQIYRADWYTFHSLHFQSALVQPKNMKNKIKPISQNQLGINRKHHVHALKFANNFSTSHRCEKSSSHFHHFEVDFVIILNQFCESSSYYLFLFSIPMGISRNNSESIIFLKCFFYAWNDKVFFSRKIHKNHKCNFASIFQLNLLRSDALSRDSFCRQRFLDFLLLHFE